MHRVGEEVAQPHPDETETDLEIRQVLAPEDFGDIAPEVIEQERRLMAEATARHRCGPRLAAA